MAKTKQQESSRSSADKTSKGTKPAATAAGKPRPVAKKAAAAGKAPAKAPASKAAPAKSAAARKPAPASKAAAPVKRAAAAATKPPAKKAPVETKPAKKAASTPRKSVSTSKSEVPVPRNDLHESIPLGLDNGVTMQDGRYALPASVEIELPKAYKPSSKEEYMGPRQLQYFRNKLSHWREELVEESRQTIESLRDEVRDVGDEAERATRETENSLELRTRDRYRKLIGKIDKALKRIEEGHYGFCEETDEEIGIDRLEARPIATLSLDAQERWEHRQKQMGD